jgi:ribosomal protein S18 acetylase RimI-like enzyme
LSRTPDIDRLRRDAETPVVATRRDHGVVAKDLADAFRFDPVFDWFMRTGPRREVARERFFRGILSTLGAGRIDRPACGGAAAVWLPFSEVVRPASLLEELRMLPVVWDACGLARLDRLDLLRRDLDRHHPMDRPHAYLWFLGVTQAAQGHGVGSRLLAAGTARLDATREPAYLETMTERNLGLYRRFGFEVISEHRPRADAPLVWSLWREPQAWTAPARTQV